MTEGVENIPYQPIRALEASKYPKNGMLSALDALRKEWERRWQELSDDEQRRIRQRSLRRLAIETGIIERLYDIEWGLTLTLVAEGFTKDVIERHGGAIDDHTRATLEAQRESLQLVLDFVRDERPLTAGFIKDLHAAMTRTQSTYVAADSLGRAVDVPLPHGSYKLVPNHVRRSDGRLLEYSPPEHVASEVERLVELFHAAASGSAHPIVLAAFLHHRFVQIHPFADGNGRVARALVLLVLQKYHFAPLVVDRFHRDKYLAALDAANEGDLGPLVRLFTNLAGASLTSELESPASTPMGTSLEVAHTLAAQLQALRKGQESKLVQALRPRAIQLSAQLKRWFESKAEELRHTFDERGLRDVIVRAEHQIGADAPLRFWFREQIIREAHRAGYYADLNDLAGWTGIRIRYPARAGDLRDVQLRYVAAMHGAGRGSGVLSIVTFAEIQSRFDEPGGDPRSEYTQITTTADAFRVVHTESNESINDRIADLTDLLDEGFAVALASFSEVFA